jgi:uncharacterized peroxidase-related enzyme
MRHHGEALRSLSKDDALVRGLSTDPDGLPLDPRRRALVRYALKLTRTPQALSREDIEALRAVGLSDAAIHDAAAITAYFNFVNRIASGLGVELEERGRHERAGDRGRENPK